MCSHYSSRVRYVFLVEIGQNVSYGKYFEQMRQILVLFNKQFLFGDLFQAYRTF